MFGFVMANLNELPKAARKRYGTVYCGICRAIRHSASQTARLGLSYDMAFLAMLLMSLYEPEETGGKNACWLHPITRRPWVDNEYIRYAADMNVALAYYNCMDDYQDEGKASAKMVANMLAGQMPAIRQRWPRQCEAMETCLSALAGLEKEQCAQPDLPADCFGKLMGELLVYREDLWATALREMGIALGRYIYLADAAVDYRRDKKKNHYNPFLAEGKPEDPEAWETILVLAMDRCTDYFERLPLVQDKEILDNILYSGIWLTYRRKLGRPKASPEENYDQ